MTKSLYEIIRVVQPDFLVNASRMACRYATADGNPLEPGYYFALWPARATARRYDRKVRYFGPFESADEAEVVQACAAYLGLVEPASTNACRCGRVCLTQAVRNTYTSLLAILGSPRAACCAASRR